MSKNLKLIDKMELIKIDPQLFSRSTVEKVRSEIANKVNEGEVDALKVQGAIAMYEKVFNGDTGKNNGLKDLIKKQVHNDFSKYGGKKIELYGYELQEAEVGVKYDYSHDHIWNSLKEQAQEIEKKIKSREAQLKVLSIPDSEKGEHNNMVMDPNTGELYEEMPPLKTSTTSVKFTLKR